MALIPYPSVYQDTAVKRHTHIPHRQDAGTRIQILMAMYNGARFLPEQLDSIAQQTHRKWSLSIRDDGSTDAGPSIVRAFAATMLGYDIRFETGPRLGAAMGFLNLLQSCDVSADAVALSDQDDVWMPEKLDRALAVLSSVPSKVPALYCGRTIVTDAALRPLGESPCLSRPPTFRNALVQNIAAGNTIVVNQAAARLLRTAAAQTKQIVAHDWWCYLLVTGAGGQILFDDNPALYYRQHGANHVGANSGSLARLRRLRSLAGGQLSRWTDCNIAALNSVSDLLTVENRFTLSAFAMMRHQPPRRRIAALRALGIYRQTRAADTVLKLATAFGKL